MIAGQALLDLFLAATRWKHRMRYEVVSRSLVEPYAAMATAAAAWFAGFEETGLLISYWAGTLMALAYAIWGTRLSFGSLALRAYRLGRGRDEGRSCAKARCRWPTTWSPASSPGSTSIWSACFSARARRASTAWRARSGRRSARSGRASTGC